MTEPPDPTAWLEFASGDRVAVTDLCTIGRTTGNRVVIPTERVSRRHAVIRRGADGGFELMDMGSSNGTWINGQRLSRPLALVNGTVIEIGLVQMIFRRQQAPAAHASEKPAVVPCWLLAVEATMRGCRMPSDGESDKTFEGWSERCQRTVKKYQGTAVRGLQDGFLAFWLEEPGIDKSATVATVLRSLRAVQSLTEEFRFAIHHGEVEMRAGASGESRPSGDEFIFALQLQKLVRMVDSAVLITGAAADKLAPGLETRPLSAREMRGHGGTARFFTLKENSPET